MENDTFNQAQIIISQTKTDGLHKLTKFQLELCVSYISNTHIYLSKGKVILGMRFIDGSRLQHIIE